MLLNNKTIFYSDSGSDDGYHRHCVAIVLDSETIQVYAPTTNGKREEVKLFH